MKQIAVLTLALLMSGCASAIDVMIAPVEIVCGIHDRITQAQADRKDKIIREQERERIAAYYKAKKRKPR